MYCLNHIAQLGRLAAELNSRGFQVLVVGESDGESAEQAAAAFSAHVHLLTDAGRSVYKLYGFGKIARVVQQSGTVVVDRHRVVRYLHRTPNPKNSLKMDELLAALDEIR